MYVILSYKFCLLDSTAGNGVLTKATVPIYATGVLTCYNQVSALSHHSLSNKKSVCPAYQLSLLAANLPGSLCICVHVFHYRVFYQRFVLLSFQEEDRKLLVGFLEDVMTMLSLSHAPLDSLKASFVELG